jgi:phenylpropionate dioxygenase-like ring-hydroxylating dioxygenase large terminal subunit
MTHETTSRAWPGRDGYAYPTGWFCIHWSDELAVGQVETLHYFGEDLVLFRGESGRAFALEPHCLHLGAHLGHGGRVSGDRIVCPWHNWNWNGDGSHALIPYSREKCKPQLRLHSWPLREWCGMVLVWHDRHRRPPGWEPPEVPEAGDPDFYPLHPHSRMLNRVRTHPQLIIENAADPYHIPPVHGGAAPRTTAFHVEGHRLTATIETVYGAGRERTWISPEGPVTAKIGYDTYGLGIGFVRFPPEAFDTVQITSHTPVDEETTDYWFMQSSRREAGDSGDRPTGNAARFLALQQQTVRQDFPIWAHMKYLERPNWAPEEERDYRALREWAAALYPPAEL